jgi:hypothetical protein
MTNFLSGPAKGQHLYLKRAPRFLRVTEDGGKFDALDQLEDYPKVTERLFAYEIVGMPGSCHINRSGGRGGFYTVATYKMVEPQPTDVQMRVEADWKKWCYGQLETKS